MKEKRAAMEIETLGYWLIAGAILVIMLAGYFILSGKGAEAIGFLKNLFRFGS